MTTNIVTAKFNNTRRATTRPITQYDYGQILRIEGIELPATYEVDFSNNEHTGDSKPQLGSASGVHIPEEYIKTGKDIYAFVYLHAGAEDGETFYWIKIPNELRPMRTSEEPTPEEQSVITETIAALNAGVKTVEDIADGLDEQIAASLEEAKDSGEFDGKDGVSPEISVEEIEGGHRVTIVGAEGSSSFDVMDGADGRWIVSVAKTGRAGVVDTYTITYSDGTTTTFTVVNGKDGEDGISPIATVSQTSTGARIAITDKHGTTTADIENGTDGVSPTATVTQTATGAMISVTDAEGTTTAEISNGQPGAPGDDGISPTVTVTDIAGGHRITITDKDGAHSFDVMDGDVADAPVQDVQVNGTSVLDAQGVANVPVASATELGTVKVSTGLAINSTGNLYVRAATDAYIKAGTNSQTYLNPSKQDAASFYGLAKAAGSDEKNSALPVGQYTDSAKSAISQMLSGSVSVSGTTPSITALPGIRYVCGEVSTLDITLPASGIVDVVFESGSTATVLSGLDNVRWANGFDPEHLDANTTYEINIADGLGVAGTWS